MFPPECITPPSDLSQDSLATYEKLNQSAFEGDTIGPVAPRSHTLRISIGPDVSAEESSSPTMAAPDGRTTPEADSSAAPPAYHLVGMIGRGGMGEVWQAVQYSLGRTVAVKRLKARRDDTMPDILNTAVRSFREEAFFSAQLEHPNIVPIHDLGVDEDGSPLLAMKLIEGSEWSDVIKADFASLPTEEFLGKHIPILMSVAQAVAFAHSKGIVHRDLKPQQVMLGGFGEVLLADWGLAIKVENQERPETPMPLPSPVSLPGPETATSPSGTPAFMAPEQTLSTARGVGTWTDVFLLGGSLYMLLTGMPPHEGSSAQAVFLQANEGKIRTPSERVGRSRVIPPELEELCLACLKHEPRERLGSAIEFVEKLKDYLTGAGRRRESVALVAEVTATLAGTGVDYRGYSDVLSKLDHARALWADNPDAADLRGRALEGHARLALSGGDLRLARLQAEAMLAANPARPRVLAEIDAADARVIAQARQRRLAVAGVIVLLAALLVSAVVFTRKVSAERDIAESRRAEAEAAKQLALEREQQVRVARSDSEEMLDFVIGDLRDSLMELDRIDLLNDAAERALAHYKRQPFETLTSDERLKVVEGLRKLGDIFKNQSRFDLATEATEVALEWIKRANETDPTTKPNVVWGGMEGQVLVARNDLISRGEGNDKGFDDAKLIIEKLKAYAAIGHVKPVHIAMGCHAAIRALERLGKQREALEYILEAEALLAISHPTNDKEEADLLSVKTAILSKRSAVEFGLSEYDAAYKSAEGLIELGNQRIAKDPEGKAGISDLADAYNLMSTLHNIREENVEAVTYAEKAIEMRLKSLAFSPLDRTARANLAMGYHILARRLLYAGKPEEAIESSSKGLEIADRLLAESEKDIMMLGNTSSALGTRSEAYSRLKESTLAIEDMRRSAELQQKVSALQPDAPLNSINLSAVQTNLGYALIRANRSVEAIPELKLAVEVISKAHASDPDNPELLKRKGECLAFYAMALDYSSFFADAEEASREAIAQLDRYLELKPDTVSIMRSRRSFESSLRSILLKQGKSAEALELARGTAQKAFELYAQKPGYNLYFTTYVSAAIGEWSALDIAEESLSARDVIKDSALRIRDYRTEYPDQDLDEYRYRSEQLWARTESYDLANPEGALEILLHVYRDIKDSAYEPRGLSTRGDVRSILSLLGIAVGQGGDHEKGLGYFDEAIALAEKGVMVANGTDTPTVDVAGLCDLSFSHLARAGYLAIGGRDDEAVASFRKAFELLDNAEQEGGGPSVPSLRNRIDAFTTLAVTLDPQTILEYFPNWYEDVTGTMVTVASMPEFDKFAINGFQQRIDRARLAYLRGIGDFAKIAELTDNLQPPDAYLAGNANMKPLDGLRLYLERVLALRGTGRDQEATAVLTSLRQLYEAERARGSLRDANLTTLCEAALALGEKETAAKDFRGLMSRIVRSRAPLNLGAAQGWLTDEETERFRVKKRPE